MTYAKGRGDSLARLYISREWVSLNWISPEGVSRDGKMPKPHLGLKSYPGTVVTEGEIRLRWLTTGDRTSLP
jgi:hypothetical protein